MRNLLTLRASCSGVFKVFLGSILVHKSMLFNVSEVGFPMYISRSIRNTGPKQKKPLLMTGKASHRIQLQIHTTCDVANTTS